MSRYKFWLATLIIISIAISYLIISNESFKVRNFPLLKRVMVTKEVQREVNSGNLEKDRRPSAIEEQVVSDAVKHIEKHDQTEIIIRSRLNRKISEIKRGKKPDSKPIENRTTRDSVTLQSNRKQVDDEQAEQISRIRLENIWEHYCITDGKESDDCKE